MKRILEILRKEFPELVQASTAQKASTPEQNTTPLPTFRPLASIAASIAHAIRDPSEALPYCLICGHTEYPIGVFLHRLLLSGKTTTTKIVNTGSTKILWIPGLTSPNGLQVRILVCLRCNQPQPGCLIYLLQTYFIKYK